jgi:hypothetical protein
MASHKMAASGNGEYLIAIKSADPYHDARFGPVG